MKPNYKHELKLMRQGYQWVAGLDEAGRGSWAGPLVAGAVILHPQNKIKDINDSKLLSPEKRKNIFLKIIKNALAWSVGIASHQEIDQLGILPANRLVFERAVKKLHLTPHYLLVDGIRNFDSNIASDFIVRGDQKILSIAAASIIAKVIRDEMLKYLHNFYPEYNFAQHKGYGTAEHFDLINRHGISEIHRQTFRPMLNDLEFATDNYF